MKKLLFSAIGVIGVVGASLAVTSSKVTARTQCSSVNYLSEPVSTCGFELRDYSLSPAGSFSAYCTNGSNGGTCSTLHTLITNI